MLEESREEVPGESMDVPDNKAIKGTTPGNDGINGGVIDHIISFGQKRGRAWAEQGIWQRVLRRQRRIAGIR